MNKIYQQKFYLFNLLVFEHLEVLEIVLSISGTED